MFMESKTAYCYMTIVSKVSGYADENSFSAAGAVVPHAFS